MTIANIADMVTTRVKKRKEVEKKQSEDRIEENLDCLEYDEIQDTEQETTVRNCKRSIVVMSQSIQLEDYQAALSALAPGATCSYSSYSTTKLVVYH